MQRTGSIVLLSGLIALSVGCESGSASEHVEDYDADREFRSLKHVRDFDFSWVNTRMQQIVEVRIWTRRPADGSPSVQLSCGGVLVGEDLVLTAAHCVSLTPFVNRACRGEQRPSARAHIRLDMQRVQGSTAGVDLRDEDAGPLAIPGRWRAPRMIQITEMVAWSNDAFARVDPTDVESSCDVDGDRADIDAVILRIAEPVGAERGYARLRAEVPAADDVLPVIHQDAGSKWVTVLRVMDRDAFIGPGVLRDALILYDVPVVPAMLSTSTGSSGSPLFDADGYVLGVLGQGCGDLSGVPPCATFSNMSVLLAEPGFAAIAAAQERPSDSGLGRFDASMLGDFQLETAPALDGFDRPLGLTVRPGGGFVTAGFSTDDSERFFTLVGYDEGGALDTAFGGGGVAVSDVALSPDEQLYDVVYADVDGTPVPFAVGSLGEPESMALARFTVDGSLDATFASGGVMRINGASAPTSGAAIAVDPRDGALVVAGHASIERPGSGALQGSPVVMRFDTAGNPDPRCSNVTWRPYAPIFGSPTTEDPDEQWYRLVEMWMTPSWDMVVNDVAVDDTGRIVLVGYLHQYNNSARVPWVGRLNEDCSVDEDFGLGVSGVAVLSTSGFATDPAAENGWISAVVIEPTTNRIFVGGTITAFDTTRGFFTGRMFAAALLSDGMPDTSFGAMGSQGGVTVFSEGWHDELHGLAYVPSIDGDEARLVLAGESYREEGRTTRRVRMASFLTDGMPDAFAWPDNAPASGVFDAWATDVAISDGGQVFVSVAHRSGPPGP